MRIHEIHQWNKVHTKYTQFTYMYYQKQGAILHGILFIIIGYRVTL